MGDLLNRVLNENGEITANANVNITLDDADLFKFLGGLFAVLLLAIIIGAKISK